MELRSWIHCYGRVPVYQDIELAMSTKAWATLAVCCETKGRSLMKDDTTFRGILHFSGLRPVAALY